MTRRPVLAPGLHVLNRPGGELQIGLTPERRVRIRDSVAVRRTLAVLDRGETPPRDAETQAVLARLAPVLRDGDVLVRPGIAPGEVAAVVLRHPSTATARLRARATSAIQVIGDLGIDPRPLLRGAGLRVAESSHGDTPAAMLVLATGEPDRRTLDPLLRDRIAHLVLTVVEADVVLGPFVVPGGTACLRCLDIARSADDPLYPVLVSPDLRTTRHDGVAEPVDSALVSMAIAWAVRDLVRYVEGDRPSTWSATVRLGCDQSSFSAVPVLRQPSCGCSWVGAQADLPEHQRRPQPSVTMEA